MKASGLFNTDQIRPVIEARMWARWKLGQLLAKFQRGTGPGRGKKEAAGQPSFKQSLATLGLNKNTAKQAERIGAMPKKKVERYLARCHRDGDLCSYKELAQRVGRERPTRAAWAILSTRKTDTNGRLIDAGENAPLSLNHRRHERFIPRGEFARDDPSPGFGTGGVQGPSTRLLRALGHRRPAERAAEEEATPSGNACAQPSSRTGPDGQQSATERRRRSLDLLGSIVSGTWTPLI